MFVHRAINRTSVAVVCITVALENTVCSYKGHRKYSIQFTTRKEQKVGVEGMPVQISVYPWEDNKVGVE